MVVIGSGAAGAVMAYQLAKRGAKVVVLERGRRYDPTTFEHIETEMYARVYKNGGLQTTDDNDLVIAQGATVGGSTVINNAIWLRCDLDRVLPDWKSHGAPVDRQALEDAYTDLEQDLHVSDLPPALANRSSKVFLRGAESLGIPARYLRHNRDECIGCGWCNFGCRYNRKASMLVTYLPWAESHGARIVDECRNVRLVSRGRAITGVRYRRHDEDVTIEAGRVVVCAGAIGSSAVLLESGISVGGRVGRGLHVLGGVLVCAEMEEELDGFDGIGLTCVAEAGKDAVIESFFGPPAMFSLSVGGWFGSHFERMRAYRRFAQAGVMVGTRPTGRVYLDRKGAPRVHLVFDDLDLRRLRDGLRTLARMYLHAGALRVLPATFKLLEFTSEADLDDLEAFVRRPDDLLLGSAHPQGGNPMHEDPSRGVVGPDFKVHGYDNLYVADASVFPTNIWANCQATVMAMSFCASAFVAR